MGRCISNWLDSFYIKKSYVELLEQMKKSQDKGEQEYYKNHQSSLTARLQYKEKEQEFHDMCQYLIGSGYLGQHKDIASQLYITDEGRRFLQEYYQFKLLGIFAKLTKLFNKNLLGATSIISLAVSFILLTISIFHKY